MRRGSNQEQVIIVNQDEKNKYGEYRGYRLLPYAGVSHLAIENSTILKNSAKWAEHDIMISKRKDTEPRNTHAYNNQDTENPPVDFSKFFDGESLNQVSLHPFCFFPQAMPFRILNHFVTCPCLSRQLHQ